MKKLQVHENPPTTSYSSKSVYDEPYAEGMITSDGITLILLMKLIIILFKLK